MGKNATLISPHNWEIMRTIVIEGRRGPLPAELFPSWPVCCCFLHKRTEKKNAQFTHCRIHLFSMWEVLWGQINVSDSTYKHKLCQLFDAGCRICTGQILFFQQSQLSLLQTERCYMTGCRWLFWDPSVAPKCLRGPSRQRMWLLPAAVCWDPRGILHYQTVWFDFLHVQKACWCKPFSDSVL